VPAIPGLRVRGSDWVADHGVLIVFGYFTMVTIETGRTIIDLI
jgi:hypothetical protein